MKKAVLAALSLLLLLSITACVIAPRPSLLKAIPEANTNLIAHFLNVGQGSCLLIQCPGAKQLVLNDCGTVSSSRAMTKAVIHDYIAQAIADNVTTTNKTPLTVFVSHPDHDHTNLISDVTYGIDHTKVSVLYHGEELSDYDNAFQSWANKLPLTKGFTRPYQADNFMACGKAILDVMTVNSNPKVPDGNTDSLVLRIRYGPNSIIIPGDATGITQRQIIDNYPAGFQPTVLAGSHHGADSAGSNDVVWAQKSNPHILIFQSGYHKSYRHPRCISVDRYVSHSTNLWTWRTHAYACDTDNDWIEKNTSEAIFTTMANGTIDIMMEENGAVSMLCERGCENPGNGDVP